MVDHSAASAALRDLAAPIVAAHSLVCEDVEVRTRGGKVEARVIVDLPETTLDAVDLDTVAEVARELSSALDGADAFMGSAPYDVEVSTPGAERVLTEPRHFRRARTRLVRTEHEGSELYARILAVSDDDVVTLRPEPAPGARPTGSKKTPENLELPVDALAGAQVVVEFSPPADVAELRSAIDQEG